MGDPTLSLCRPGDEDCWNCDCELNVGRLVDRDSFSFRRSQATPAPTSAVGIG
jgi:hypothetical protein